MASADVQILGTGKKAAPLDYVLPSGSELLLKAVRADFDGTGALGDFLPALEIISDAGHSVGVYPTDVAVAAGASASVSFAPFLRNAPASTGAGAKTSFGYVSGTFFNPHSGGNDTIANNTVAELGWAATQFGGSLVCLGRQSITPGNGDRVTVAAGGFGGPVCTIAFHIKVVWPAFAGRRYIELAPNNGDPAYAIPLRLEGTATPRDDIQVLAGTFTEQVGVLTGMVVNCYQASGVAQTLVDTPWAQFIATGPVT